MKIVYIAGPFRGPTAWAIAENIRKAERWGECVTRYGHMPLIPHANTAHFHGLKDDQFWLDGTMELLRRCDAVLMIPDWEKSSGARAEKAEAERLKIPVFKADRDSILFPDDFHEWTKKPDDEKTPVFQRHGKWWFWDETWTDAHGPYESEGLADDACIEYARTL